MVHGGKTASVRTSVTEGSARYQAGSVFRVPRARLIARWPRFIERRECTTETVFRRWFFAAVIARYRLLIARTFELARDERSLDRFGERSSLDENAKKRGGDQHGASISYRRQPTGCPTISPSDYRRSIERSFLQEVTATIVGEL